MTIYSVITCLADKAYPAYPQPDEIKLYATKEAAEAAFLETVKSFKDELVSEGINIDREDDDSHEDYKKFSIEAGNGQYHVTFLLAPNRVLDSE